MKKRLLSLVLALTMVLSLLPATALATTGEENVAAGITMQYDDYYTIEGANKVEVTADNTIVEVSDTTIHAIGVGSTTVNVDGENRTITVEKAKIHVVLVDGQSNAQGIHGTRDVEPIVPADGDGYIWNGTGLGSLGGYVADKTASKSVGWYPALAYEWHKLTDEKMVIIHKYISGAPITNWASYAGAVTTTVTNNANAVKSCIAFLTNDDNKDKYEIVQAGYYWLQGETDAQRDTAASDYEVAYLAMHNAYIQALNTAQAQRSSYGAIFSVRPCSWTPWLNNVSYEGVRAAQMHMANSCDDLYMASILTDLWHTDGTRYVSYTADSGLTVGTQSAAYQVSTIIGSDGHYNQAGYNILGLEGADNMYNALVENAALADLELVGYDGYTVYLPNSSEDTIDVSESVIDGVSGYAQLAVRPVPIGANFTGGVTFTVTNSEGEEQTGVIDQTGRVTLSRVGRDEALTLTVTAKKSEQAIITKTYKLVNSQSTNSAPVTQGNKYYWDFTDSNKRNDQASTMEAVTTGGWSANTLTYVQSADDTTLVTIEDFDSEKGLVKSTQDVYFKMTTPVVLRGDTPWAIEWQGAMANSSSALAYSNGDTVNSSTYANKAEHLYLNGNSFQIKRSTSVLINLAVSEAAKAAPDTIWRITNDGSGKVTLSCTNVRLNYAVTNTSAILTGTDAAFTFDGLMGRIGKVSGTWGCCYVGNMVYMCIWESEIGTVPTEERLVAQYIGDNIFVGDELTKADFTVSKVTSSSVEPVNDFVIWVDTSTEGTKEVTISAGGLSTTLSVIVIDDYDANSYFWDFTKDANRNGSYFSAEVGNGWSQNDLTYLNADQGDILAEIPTLNEETGLDNSINTYFDLTTPICLNNDLPWKIEWRGAAPGANILLMANNDDAGSISNNDKGCYIYITYDPSTNRHSVTMRDSGVTGGTVTSFILAKDELVTFTLENVDGKVKFSALKEDGTLMTGTSSTVMNSPYYTYTGILGRFNTTNMEICYDATIQYMKVYECTHPDTTYDAGFAATCVAAGEKAHWTCEACNHVFLNEQCTQPVNSANDLIIPATGHSGGSATCKELAVCTVCNTSYGELAAHTWVDATCTAPKTCSVCNTIDGEALGHSYGAPNYQWNGNTACTGTRICTRDENHTEIVEAMISSVVSQEASCTQVELTTYTATFSNDAFATQTKANVQTAGMSAHSYTVPQSDADGHWKKCANCDATDTKENHTPNREAATEKDAVVCNVCNYVITPATGHVVHTYSVLKSDSTHHWYKCTGCEKISEKTVHSGGTATCTTKAVCVTCETAYGDYAAHTKETIPAVAPTCTETGLTEGIKCSVCKEVLKTQEVVAASGHSYTAIVTAPTCIEGGYTTYTCVCGDTYVDDETDALGHSYDNAYDADCNVCGEVRDVVDDSWDDWWYDYSEPTYSVNAPAKVENGSVTANLNNAEAGDRVTVTVTPDEGYELVDLIVTDRKGNEIEVTDRGDGKFTFTMPASKVTITATFEEIEEERPVVNPGEHPFTDVPDGEWYSDGVQYAHTYGLMNGLGTTDYFGLYETTNRAMIWTILARLSGVDTSTGATWDAVGKQWAIDNGISDGSNAAGAITREQLVTMLWRYAGEPDVSINALSNMRAFPDCTTVSTWAQDAMAWAIAFGIINGVDGTLSPAIGANRATVATILMRFCENIK